MGNAKKSQTEGFSMKRLNRMEYGLKETVIENDFHGMI
jgi:hypothetical protein